VRSIRDVRILKNDPPPELETGANFKKVETVRCSDRKILSGLENFCYVLKKMEKDKKQTKNIAS